MFEGTTKNAHTQAKRAIFKKKDRCVEIFIPLPLGYVVSQWNVVCVVINQILSLLLVTKFVV